MPRGEALKRVLGGRGKCIARSPPLKHTTVSVQSKRAFKILISGIWKLSSNAFQIASRHHNEHRNLDHLRSDRHVLPAHRWHHKVRSRRYFDLGDARDRFRSRDPVRNGSFFCELIPILCRYSGATCGVVYVFFLPVVVHMMARKRQGKLTLPSKIVHGAIILLGILNFVAQFVIKPSVWRDADTAPAFHADISQIFRIFRPSALVAGLSTAAYQHVPAKQSLLFHVCKEGCRKDGIFCRSMLTRDCEKDRATVPVGAIFTRVVIFRGRTRCRGLTILTRSVSFRCSFKP